MRRSIGTVAADLSQFSSSSGLAHQVDLHLVKLKIGVQEIEITSALLNACVFAPLLGVTGALLGIAIANLDGNFFFFFFLSGSG